MTHSTTVSLVLGSGGARGLSHIGVIQWLTENGYEISSIAGSSMGALVGGIFATGKLEIYAEWASCGLRTTSSNWSSATRTIKSAPTMP